MSFCHYSIFKILNLLFLYLSYLYLSCLHEYLSIFHICIFHIYMNIFHAYFILGPYQNMLSVVFLIKIFMELILDSYAVVRYRDSVNSLPSLPQYISQNWNTILYVGYFRWFNPPALFRFYQFCVYSFICAECVSSIQFSPMWRSVKILNSFIPTKISPVALT